MEVCYFSEQDMRAVREKGPILRCNEVGGLVAIIEEESYYYEIRMKAGATKANLSDWFNSYVKDENIIEVRQIRLSGIPTTVLNIQLKNPLPMGDIIIGGKNKAWVFRTNSMYVKFSV